MVSLDCFKGGSQTAKGEEVITDLEHRIPEKESPPSPTTGERVLHHDFFGRGLGFPLHKFVCGLLYFFGCQLHHLTPNEILHIASFITFYECYMGTVPHFKLFCHFFRI